MFLASGKFGWLTLELCGRGTQGAVGDFDPQRKKLASDNIFPNATDMRSLGMPIICLGVGEVLNALSRGQRRKRLFQPLGLFCKR